MRKKLSSAFFIFLFISASVYVSGEQKSIIGVGTIDSNNSQVFKPLSAAAGRTLALNLKLLGGYECTDLSDLNYTSLKNAVPGFLRQGIDNAIAGNLRENNGVISLSMAVYGRNEEKIILEDSIKIDNYLEIFEAVDTLSIRMIEALTKSRLSIGALMIENRGMEYPYKLIIDNTFIGENTGKIQNLRAGKREVKIEEISTGRTITKKYVSITEGQTTKMQFSVPSLEKEESAILSEYDRIIGINWGNPLAQNTVLSAVSGALGFTEKRNSRVMDLLENKYTELKKTFDNSGYYYSFVPAAHIEIDGDLNDWENIPVFINDVINSPQAAVLNPADPANKPGSDIGTGKIAISRDSKTLYFLINTINGNISSGVEYTFALAKDNNKYLQYRIFNGSSRIRYWFRSDGHSEPVNTGSSFKIKDNYLEGSIDISRTDFYYDILDSKCRVHLKTVRPDPYTTYNIAGDKPLRLSPFLRYNSAGDRQPDGVTPPDTSGFMTASGSSHAVNNIYFLTSRNIKIDGKTEDWSGTEPASDRKEWADGWPSLATDLDALYLAGNDDYLYAGAYLDGEDVQFQPEGRVTEIAIKGDNTPDGGYYLLEIRLRSAPQLYVRKVTFDNKKFVITTVKDIKGLNFKYSPATKLLEISAPMKLFSKYMQQKGFYELTFGIRDEKTKESKITQPVKVCF